MAGPQNPPVTGVVYVIKSRQGRGRCPRQVIVTFSRRTPDEVQSGPRRITDASNVRRTECE